MSKDKISDYSATANSNTDIAGINIDEGCAPSGINNAIRTLMKQLKDWQSGSQDVYITPAGSAAAPAVTTTGDTNTGVYFPAADTVGVTTGGTERVRVDSSGNVGIGTSSPATLLDVAGLGRFAKGSSNGITIGDVSTNSNSVLRLQGTSAGKNWQIANNLNVAGLEFTPSTANGGTTFTTPAVAIDSSGNVGIGTSSPSVKLHVSNGNIRISNTANTVRTEIANDGIYSAGTDLYVYSPSSYNTIFYAGGAERARIDSSGNLLVGMTTTTSSPTYGGVYVVGDRNTGGTNYYAQMFMAHNSNTNHGFVIKELASGGGIAIAFRNSSMTAVGEISTSPTNTTYGTSSDYRLKENIAPMTGALATVAQLKPCTYTWKADGSTGQGFIAHELQAVVPDCVTGEKDAVETYVDEDGNEQTRPRYQGIDTSFLVATLTAAIQELKAVVDAQAARIEALEAK